MEKFIEHVGVATYLDNENIDTDQIIPKQFLLSVSKKGFGKHLFHDWRYLDDKETVENKDFNLNKEIFKNASILVAGDNFGCGSSREHAPWALIDYGFKVIIAPSFANIFNHNALNNGLLTVPLTKDEVNEIIENLKKTSDPKIRVSLDKEEVEAFGKIYKFKITPFYRECLLNGYDNISLTLLNKDKIKDYENKAFNLMNESLK